VRTKTVVKYTRNLTPQEYTQCYQRNLGNGGNMRRSVASFWRDRDVDSKVVLIKDEKDSIIAWAMTHAEHQGEEGVMFWVQPEYRRMGYGTRLLAHTQKKVHATPRVFPHDKTSGLFFKSHLSGVKVARYDRFWIDA